MTQAAGDESPPDPRRIHLVRPQNQLGDLLLNVPAIRCIRERFPRAHLTLVVGRQNASAVMGQPWADEIRVVDTRNALGLLGDSLRPGRRPDLAIYFTTVSYSKSGAYRTRATRARERVGFDPGHYGERDRAALTRAVPFPGRPLHQSEVSLVLARAVGAAAEPPPPPTYIPDPALVERAPRGVAYLHPGAGKVKNRWPADRFAAVARELLARGVDVAWIEGPQDEGCVGAANRALGKGLPVVRDESIPMLAARFAAARVYVGNDTGPLHLAAATGCPSVGIYGWSDPSEWSPVGRVVRTVRADDHSLESVPPSQVLDQVLPLLEEEPCALER
jgi:ADP-heptose:LPS heptosyltransferase